MAANCMVDVACTCGVPVKPHESSPVLVYTSGLKRTFDLIPNDIVTPIPPAKIECWTCAVKDNSVRTFFCAVRTAYDCI